jgi:hypothetical protein
VTRGQPDRKHQGSSQRSMSRLFVGCIAITIAGCAGGSGSPGTGSGGGSSTGGTLGQGGTGTGGSTGSGGTSASGGNPGSGGNTGSGGAANSGGTTGSGGATTGGTTGSGGMIATGGTTGSGGNAPTGGTTGTGGSPGTGGSAAAGGSTGSGGIPATGGATGSGGSAGGSGGCPANATFCSGFETTDQPAGSIYNYNAGPGPWTRDFAVDTAQHHSGNSSLRVKSGESGASGAYQMLAVPATPTAFWARFWMMSAMTIGQQAHNAYAGASVGSGANDLMIELADDTGVAFNTKDQDCFPTVGCTGQHPTTFYNLPAMTWECIEISYDVTNQVQQLYINGSLTINAPNYPGSTVASSVPYFKFGLDAYQGPPRDVWYDDVAVAPTRIGGCQ